jgi:hypothetical protein
MSLSNVMWHSDIHQDFFIFLMLCWIKTSQHGCHVETLILANLCQIVELPNGFNAFEHS